MILKMVVVVVMFKGVKCKDFVKWCDEPVAESDFQPPMIKYPECACKAGVCRRVKDKDTDGVFKYYFTCPVKQVWFMTFIF